MVNAFQRLAAYSVLLVLPAGCGSNHADHWARVDRMTTELRSSDDGPARAMDVGAERLPRSRGAALVTVPQPEAADTSPRVVAVDRPSGIANRKIIYRSTVALVVDDYVEFESQLPALVSRHGGYVAKSETDRRYRDQQSGRWTARIPVAEHDSFLQGVSALGFAESHSDDADDVTEEYIDLESRARNKRTLEHRLLKMLEARDGKLSDALEIERELSRVREEIEGMEGRIRFLTDHIRLSTVTIDCREEEAYRPATAPTLSSRIARSWGGSLSSLRLTAESALLAVVAVIPWFAAVGLPLWIGWKLLRKGRSRAIVES